MPSLKPTHSELVKYSNTSGTVTNFKFSNSNSYTVTHSPKLTYTPSSCIIGINALDNDVTIFYAPITLNTTTSSMTMTSFVLSITLNQSSYYKRLSFSYFFADPSFNVFKFYFIPSPAASLVVTSAMIGGQPVSNVKGLTIRGLDINYTYPMIPINNPPYTFEVLWNGTAIVSTKNSVINRLKYDVSLITYNISG